MNVFKTHPTQKKSEKMFMYYSSNRDELWLVVSDLNELVDNTEKLGGPNHEEASFSPFRNMIQDCRIREVTSSGNKLSWAGEHEKQ